MALTKANLAERLYDDIRLNKREAREMVEDFFEEIRAGLESGQLVKLSGFGRFNLFDRRNDQAGTPRPGKRRSSPPGEWLPSIRGLS